MKPESDTPTEPSPPPSHTLPPAPSSRRGKANPKISFIVTGQGYPTLDEVKIAYINFVLHAHNGHRSKAAQALRIRRETLYRTLGRQR